MTTRRISHGITLIRWRSDGKLAACTDMIQPLARFLTRGRFAEQSSGQCPTKQCTYPTQTIDHRHQPVKISAVRWDRYNRLHFHRFYSSPVSVH